MQLHKRAEKIAVMLMERGHLQDGDHVALVYPPGEEAAALAGSPHRLRSGPAATGKLCSAGLAAPGHPPLVCGDSGVCSETWGRH